MPFGNIKFLKVIAELRGWTHLNYFDIIYDSEKEELSARQINSKILGRSNITIIVRTSEGFVFGSYHQNSIKLSRELLPIRYKQDGGYFLFTLHNSYGIKPQVFYTTKHKDYMVLHSDESDNGLIGMCSAYDLRISNSSFSSEFAFIYNTDFGADLFVGKTRPNTFEISNIIILRWY